ncbi:unnamed protein product [Anisakis simplex]|uniref:Uncharacterized protein n=1 Tax=Anisakis simplex TaxID=6269 RepID=A0A0M3JYW7_ANISI|nr:unnamed protein product [Anisakis simplex]
MDVRFELSRLRLAHPPYAQAKSMCNARLWTCFIYDRQPHSPVSYHRYGPLMSNYSPIPTNQAELDDLSADHELAALTPSEPASSWHHSKYECLAPRQFANITINAWLQTVDTEGCVSSVSEPSQTNVTTHLP